MGNFKHAAVLAAGVAAVFTAAPVLAADSSPSLQSFGASRAISAYELSAPGVSGGAVQPAIEALLSGSTRRLTAPGLPAMASSVLVAPTCRWMADGESTSRRASSAAMKAFRLSCRR